MRLFPLFPICFALLSGCSGTPVRKSTVYAAGEKATIGSLTYSVVDTEIQTRLGEDSSARFPQTRFFIVHLAVSNGGNANAAIPGLTLVDDSGRSYPELADGSGVAHWLGVVRQIAPASTERGSIVFDAPAGHYKLKLTDESNDSDAFIDIPLTFVHEQMNDIVAPAGGPANSPAGPARGENKPGKK